MAINDVQSEAIPVACAQLAPVFGEIEGNRALAAEAIRAAAEAGAKLVVLPELCVTGYAFADESEARELGEASDGDTLAGWSEQAREYGIVIVGGFCELDAERRPRNSAALIDRHGLRSVYRKSHLWDREQLIFVAGSHAPPVVTTDLGRIGLAVCYDAFFPEVMRSLALRGADLIAVPMNSPLTEASTTPLAIEVVLAIAAAHVNRVFVAQADRAGTERGIEWAQASVICDPSGHMLAGPQAGATLLQASCALARARDKGLGQRNDVFADRRPDLYMTASPAAMTKETVR